ncbi:hypothetical protein GCM10028808_72990 [Spirosoma migulaei]
MLAMAGAMLSATAVEEVDTHTSRNVSAQSNQSSTPKQQDQQEAVKPDATVVSRWVWPDERFAYAARKRAVVRKSANWSPNTSRSFNKIKHGRNARRKHRRS